MNKSAYEVREEFVRTGMTIQDWARANGYPPADVYALLAGRTLGRRGKAHEIALRLGMKQPVQHSYLLLRDGGCDGD